MTEHEEERGVAPVIPLFGARSTGDTSVDRAPSPSGSEAPVRRLSGAQNEHSPGPRHPARIAQLRAELAAVVEKETGPVDGAESAMVDAVRDKLVRKLRTRPLSVREARDALREADLSAAEADAVIDEFERYAYLDDRALADALVVAGSERKGQGRVAIGRTLAQRGIPREIADQALSALEDDDADRALEFARTRARALARFDDDTALRRLVGQLARRGFGGGVAMTAARDALREDRGELRTGASRGGLGSTSTRAQRSASGFTPQGRRGKVRFEE